MWVQLSAGSASHFDLCSTVNRCWTAATHPQLSSTISRQTPSGSDWIGVGPRVGQSGPEWARVGQIGPEWARVDQSGADWIRVGQSGSQRHSH